jgi:hypothetical protein
MWSPRLAGYLSLIMLGAAYAPSSAADEPESSDPLIIEPQAEAELKATPKSIDSALRMVHLHNGYAAALSGALGRETLPNFRDERKADLWKKRVIEACKDPTTLGCGQEIWFRPDGQLVSFGFMDLQGMGDGHGGGSGIRRTKEFLQPVTIRIFNQGRTLRRIASVCAVSGLGYGKDAGAYQKVTSGWQPFMKGYREETGQEPNFVVECRFSGPFFPKEPSGQSSIVLKKEKQNLHIHGKNYLASTAIWRLLPNNLTFMAAVPESRER